MPDGRGSSSGPLVAKGKVIQGMGGCQQYVEQKCFISAYDARPASSSGGSTPSRATASRAATPGAA